MKSVTRFERMKQGGRAVAVAGAMAVLWCADASAGQASQAQAAAAPQQEQPSQAAPGTTRVFASDAGLVLNFIKPDRTADFEEVIARLKDALERSYNPERKQQAATWKVFRALEPGANGSVLYVFDIDPAVAGADYTVSTILAEAFPDQVQALYRKYADAYVAGQNFDNLKLFAALGQ